MKESLKRQSQSDDVSPGLARAGSLEIGHRLEVAAARTGALVSLAVGDAGGQVLTVDGVGCAGDTIALLPMLVPVARVEVDAQFAHSDDVRPAVTDWNAISVERLARRAAG